MSEETIKALGLEGKKSYIMSAYVKYMESAGARVVPIIYGEDPAIVKDKLSKLDGILFPGGGGDYIDNGKMALEHVMADHDAGNVYPLWGTCLGFERLLQFTATKGMDVLESMKAQHVSLPLTFDVPPQDTRMFHQMGPAAEELAHNNFTYNNHQSGISTETMKSDKGLADFWTATSHSYTTDTGEPFVASMEAKEYPIFGTQFHPEKVSELWVDGIGIDHSWENIQIHRGFSDLLVELARFNTNSFGSFAET